jgi:hypothetical protein
MSEETDDINEETFTYVYKSSGNIELFPKAIRYLVVTYERDVKEIFSDQIGLMAFYLVGKCIAYETVGLDLQLIESTGYHVFLGKMMSYFCEVRHELDLSTQSFEMYHAHKATEFTEKQTLCLRYTLYKINLIILQMGSFAKSFTDTSGLKAHLAILNDDEFVEKNLETTMAMWTNKNMSLIEYLVLNVASLSKFSEESKQKWIELDAINILLNTSKKMPSSSFECYSAVTNVANDDQIEKLEEINEYANLLGAKLKRFNDLFESGESPKRAIRQIFENNKRISCDITVLDEANKTTTSLCVILQGFYKLAINSKMKSDIYFNLKGKEYFKTIILRGNHYEVKYTLR